MAAPSVLARTSNASSTTNATSFSVTMPAITAGKSLLAVVSADGNPTLSTSSTGWVLISQASNGVNVTGAIFWKKVASGSDTLTVTSSASEQFSAVTLCIDAGSYPCIFATNTNGSSTNSNPPANDTLKARDILWIATRSGDSTVTASAAPTNFSNLQTRAGGGTSGASTNTAERQLTATASQDPGTFTSATEQWVSYTVAIWDDGADPLATWVTARDHPTNNATCMVVGDSWSAGWIATNTAGTTFSSNSRAVSWPAVLAANFQACPGSSANWFGDGGAGYATVAPDDYDTRLTLGGSWGTSYPDDGSFTAGGGGLRTSAAGSDVLAFAPGVQFDRLRVLFTSYSGSPQNTVNVDGGSSLGTLAQNAADSLTGTTFNVTDSTHTINVVAGGAFAYMIACWVWRSSVKTALFLNAGFWGSTLANWITDGNLAEPLHAIRVVAADLYFMALGANDMLGAVSDETFKANYRTLVLNQKISGSVVALGWGYVDPTHNSVSEVTQRHYSDMAMQVADELNCYAFHVKDQTNWDSYANTLAAGYFSTDNTHPSSTGYASLASMFRPLIDTTVTINSGAGTATGTGAASGVGRAIKPAAGSAVGTGAGTGAGAARTAAAGSSAGVGAASAGGVALAPAAGASAGSGAATAVGAAIASAAGTATGSGSTTGAASSTAASAGLATGDCVGLGGGAWRVSSAGSATGFGTGSGAGTARVDAAGSAAGTGGTSGSASQVSEAVGTAAGSGAASAQAGNAGTAAGVGAATAGGSSFVDAVGSASGVGSATGVAKTDGDGLAAGVGAASAEGAARLDGVGASAGAGAAQGGGAARLDGAGSSAGAGGCSAAATATAAAAGSATGSGAATAAAKTFSGATGSAAGIGSADGDSESTAASDGEAAGASDGFGSGAARLDAAGLAQGTSFAGAFAGSFGFAEGAGGGSAAGASTAATAGASAGAGSASATAFGIISAQGASAGSSSASAVGAMVVSAAGTAAGSGAASAVATSTAETAGSAAGVGEGLGDATPDGDGHGEAEGVGAASGGGSPLLSASATSAGAATAAATATAVIAGAGTAAATGAALCSGAVIGALPPGRVCTPALITRIAHAVSRLRTVFPK